MIPLHFGVPSAPLYGVLHPAAEPRGRRALLVMGPWGWEALRAHRTLRSLADKVAERGMDALRFDYSGSGDSWGDHADISVAGWLEDSEYALEELRATAGVRRVSVVGLRLGGLLAGALAARRPTEVDRLILWEAPRSGQEFLGWMEDAPRTETNAFPVPPAFRAEVEELEGTDFGRFRGHVLWVGDRPPRREAAGVRSFETLTPREPLSPCWVEDQEFGAGAVPTRLLDEMVGWFDG